MVKLKEFIENLPEDQEPHVIIAVFSDSDGNLDGVVQKVTAPSTMAKGLAHVAKDVAKKCIADIDKKIKNNADDNVADLMTKALRDPDFNKFLKEKGLPDIQRLHSYKDRLNEIKDLMDDDSVSLSDKLDLKLEAEGLMKKTMEELKKVSNSDSLKDALKNKKSFDEEEQSNIEDFMNRFGKGLENPDPDSEIDDSDLI